MRGSARGKVILVGEHFVVYGHPAIVSGIDKKLTVVARYDTEDNVAPHTWDNPKVLRAIGALRAKEHLPPLSVKVFTEFPAGAGLGASAAFSVALARAVGSADVLRVSHGMEKAFHGNPSGVDTAAAFFGRPLVFKKGSEPVPLRSPGIHLLLVYSGKRELSTSDLVSRVKELREREPNLFVSLERAYERVFAGALEALEERDPDRLGTCFRANQSLLRRLGVSSGKIEKVITFLEEHGSTGAKLTGAGSGGFVVGVFPARRDARSALRAARNRFPLALAVKV